MGALVGYSGGGGVLNITLSNWARDKGYGMGSRVGHIGGMVGGERSQLADTGFIFEADAAEPRAAGVAGGASCASINGAFSSSARCSA